MENIKIFSNFMKLKKFKNWSVNDLAKEVFNILHDDGICHLSSAEEEDEIRSFCERFSRGLKRLETNDKKEPCVKLYKDKSTKFTWKQYWEAISKEYPDVQSQSEVLDNIDNDKELEIKRIIDKTIETQEILSWDSDLQIYFNAATLFYNNKPKSILDAWELLDKNYNEQNRLENLAEKHNIGSLQTYLGNFYFYKKQKYSKSLEFYKSAAQNYDVLALYQLGQIYEIGVNGHIEKDIDKAMEYYKEATEIDFPFAFNKLAYLSYCTRKYQQFFEYASKSAEINGFNPLPIIEGPIMLDMDGNIKRSNKQQQFPNYLGVLYLGFAYQEGLGVNKNLSKAIQLYEHFLEFPFNHWTQPVLTRLFLLLKECAQNEEDITKAKNAFYKLWENTDSSILKFEDNLLGLNPDLINDIENAKYFSHDNGSSILLKSIVKRFTS